MEIPNLTKEYLTVDEVAERWTDKTGKTITTDRVIAHGEDGSLKFCLIHDMSWVDYDVSSYYRIGFTLEPNEPEAKKPFNPFFISPKQLTNLLKASQPFDVGYLLGHRREFYEDTELFESRYIPISKHNLIVTLEEVKRFERLASLASETQELPDYINPNHLHYAEEIDIAIQAHKAIFKEKYGNPYQSNSERVISWLQKKYPEKSKYEAFLKRIKTVVLPKKGNHKKL